MRQIAAKSKRIRKLKKCDKEIILKRVSSRTKLTLYLKKTPNRYSQTAGKGPTFAL
jgi:hypothetical protein